MSGLVDGALRADERARALAHLERCSACRLQVEAERHAKVTLQALPTPPPPAALLESLRRLPDAPHVPSRPARDRPAPPGSDRPPGRTGETAGWGEPRRPGAAPAGGTSRGTSGPGRAPLSRARSRAAAPVRAAVAAVGVMGASLSLAYLAAGAAPVAPSVGPAAVRPAVATAGAGDAVFRRAGLRAASATAVPALARAPVAPSSARDR